MGTYIVPLQDIREDEVERCGGKAASLGKLTRMGARVPPGFCIVSEALSCVLDTEGLTDRIEGLARKLDFSDFAKVDAGCKEIRGLVASVGIPSLLSRDTCDQYAALVTSNNRFVAVRSSVAVIADCELKPPTSRTPRTKPMDIGEIAFVVWRGTSKPRTWSERQITDAPAHTPRLMPQSLRPRRRRRTV